MEEQFLRLLTRLQGRLRWVTAWQAALLWSWWGCWCSLLAAGLLKLLDSPSEDLWNAPWIAVVLGLCGFCRSWERPPSLKRTALLTDSKYCLQERVVSVLEQQQSRRPHTAVAQFLLQDGLNALKTVDPASTFPNPVQRPLARLLFPLAAVFLVNQSPSWGLLNRVPRGDRQAIHRSGERIAELAKRLRQQNPRSFEAHRIAARLERLARKLRQLPGHPLDRNSATLELDQTLRQLRRERSRELAQKARAELQMGTGESKAANQSPAVQTAQGAEEKLNALIANEAEEALVSEDQSLDPKESHPSTSAGQSTEPRSPAREATSPNEKGQQGSTSGQGVSETPASTNPGVPGGATTKSEGPADYGHGTTNTEQKTEAGSRQGHLERQATIAPSKQEAFRRLYSAQREHFQSAEASIKGQRGKGRLLSSQGSGLGRPSVGGGSQPLGSEQFYLESRADAEQAIVQGSIPAPYQEAVRNYFNQIDPR